ncbi:hypothetical protein NKH84_26505 [Mesorhizobium sp. M0902]|uniref:hypothetical protein n=1 Tax=unclassified Mesorhizobium TaxID=325217 RepID=UPI00333C05FA
MAPDATIWQTSSCCALLEHQVVARSVLIDRFNDEGSAIDAHLTEKFSVELTEMLYSKEYRLRNILGLHYQAAAIAEYAERREYTIVETYKDARKSGLSLRAVTDSSSCWPMS